VSVKHNSLDISHVGVALKCSSIETNLLTHFGNLFSIVLSEQIQLEDTLSNVWSAHEVNLKDFGLEVTLIWSIAFESIQQEGSAFLDLIELQESIHDLVDVSFWWALISVGYHLGKTDSGLWVHWHDLSKDLDEIWDMSCLLAVWHNLIKLIGFDQTLDNLVWGSRFLIDVESHLWISLSNKVTELISHGKFLFLDPILNQVKLVLSNDGSSKLNRLNSIKLCGL